MYSLLDLLSGFIFETIVLTAPAARAEPWEALQHVRRGRQRILTAEYRESYTS